MTGVDDASVPTEGAQAFVRDVVIEPVAAENLIHLAHAVISICPSSPSISMQPACTRRSQHGEQ